MACATLTSALQGYRAGTPQARETTLFRSFIFPFEIVLPARHPALAQQRQTRVRYFQLLSYIPETTGYYSII